MVNLTFHNLMMQKLKKVDNVNGKRRAYYYLKNED
jgi:hypothetical protein